MAHSISSTRALQATGAEREDICGTSLSVEKGGDAALTSASDVLCWSGCVAQAQEETQGHERRDLRSGFPHFESGDRFCITQADASTGERR